MSNRVGDRNGRNGFRTVSDRSAASVAMALKGTSGVTIGSGISTGAAAIMSRTCLSICNHSIASMVFALFRSRELMPRNVQKDSNDG